MTVSTAGRTLGGGPGEQKRRTQWVLGVRVAGGENGGAQKAEGGGQSEEKVKCRTLSADLKPTCGGKVFGALDSG